MSLRYKWIGPAPLQVRPSGAFTPATPGHCRLRGHIAALQDHAPPVDFVLALPDEWNGRALQFGDDGLDGLPFDQRSAIVLREIDGLSYEEIAFSLDIAVGTVKSRLARAREALRAQLRTV